jgi:S-(hydroxymethyl)glutathione dehydrogenase / alcohol dehydrogenase
VLTKINAPLEIVEVEQEPPKAGEVRVKVKAAGVCMSAWRSHHLYVHAALRALPLLRGGSAGALHWS